MCSDTFWEIAHVLWDCRELSRRASALGQLLLRRRPFPLLGCSRPFAFPFSGVAVSAVLFIPSFGFLALPLMVVMSLTVPS